MAIFKTVSPKNHYKDERIYKDEIAYITNPKKTLQKYIWTQGVRSIQTAAQDMKDLTEFYGKDHGTRIRHMILSFNPREPIREQEAFEVGRRITAFFAPEYQMVGAVHIFGKEYLHIHLVMNPVRISDGKKYKGSRSDFYEFTQYMKRLLREYDCKCYTVSCKDSKI